MKINSLSHNTQYLSTTTEKIEKEEKDNINKTANEEIRDEYISQEEMEKDIPHENPTYKIDRATIQRLKAESQRAYDQLRALVKQLLEKQGMTFNDLDPLGEDIEIDEATRLEAQKMIGEGGPLSPEAVSNNLVEFAIAISGGDKSKLEELKTAIDKGFKEAEKIWGGKLPEISYETYELTMKKLDAWASEE